MVLMAMDMENIYFSRVILIKLWHEVQSKIICILNTQSSYLDRFFSHRLNTKNVFQEICNSNLHRQPQIVIPTQNRIIWVCSGCKPH